MDEEYKLEARKLAINIAERIKPQPSYPQGFGHQPKTEVSSLLSDADKIYEWLTKEVK